jgi:hypothetical protein
MRKLYGKFVLATVTTITMLAVDSVGPLPIGSFVSQAQAIVGRPLTAGSVAGVARRTTRRVIRRSSVYVATLPTGCISTSINAAVVWRCGGAYYQPYNGRYVVVYVD